MMMKRFALILTMLMAAIYALAATPTIADDAKIIVHTSADSILGGDILDEDNELDKYIADSLKRSKTYWRRMLMKGKLDLNDDKIVYPRFVKFCVDLYKWGDRTFNTYDSAYVVGTGKRWKVIIKNDNWVDNYDLHFPKSTPVRLLSNVCSNIGGSLAFMAVSAGYMFDVDNVFGGNAVTHKKWDFSFTYALLSADLYYYTNTGASVIRRFGDYANGAWINVPFHNLNQESMGADIYYFVNNKKYAQGAAYNYSKIQKRSAGSVILGVTLSSHDVSLDFSELNNEMIAVLPDMSNLYYRFRYYDYCFLLGYGYNCVMGKHWLFNISSLPSIGVKHCMEDSEEGKNDMFSANLKAKLAFVYNNNDFFAGFTGKMDLHWYSSRRYNFFNAVENFNFCAGWRF